MQGKKIKNKKKIKKKITGVGKVEHEAASLGIAEAVDELPLSISAQA